MPYANPASLRPLLLLACVLSAVLLPERGQAADQRTAITLLIGEQYALDVSDAREVNLPKFERGEKVLLIEPTADKKYLQVQAASTGKASILVRTNSGTLRLSNFVVYARHPDVIQTELQELLGGISGITLKVMGGVVYILGGVPVAEDLQRIDKLVASYGGQVISLAAVDPSRQRTNIRLVLHFVQVRRDSGYQFGVKWPSAIGIVRSPQTNAGASISYDIVKNTIDSGRITVAENMLPMIDVLGTRGWARINKSVTLTTTNGGTTTYHSGGEVNVKIATSLGQSVLEKIPFGVRITVRPRRDEHSDVIGVTLDAEQSELTPVPGQEVPGRNLTTTKTTLHVKLGQQIVLSGFREDSELLESNGIPGLMRIPLLGYLFRTERHSWQDGDSLLFITVNLADDIATADRASAERIIKRWTSTGSYIVY